MYIYIYTHRNPPCLSAKACEDQFLQSRFLVSIESGNLELNLTWCVYIPRYILRPDPSESHSARTAFFFGMSTWFLGSDLPNMAPWTIPPTFHKRVIHRRLTYSSHIFSLGSYVSLRGSTLHTVYIYIDLLTRSIFMFLISAFLFLPNQRWKINLNDLICFSIFIFERPNKTRMIPSSWHCALPRF